MSRQRRAAPPSHPPVVALACTAPAIKPTVPRHADHLWLTLGSIVLSSCLVAGSFWVFRPARPHAVLSSLHVAILTVPVGLALLAASVLVNLKLVARYDRVFATLNVVFSVVLVWFIAAAMVAGVDVTYDESSPRRVTARVKEQVYRTSGRGSRHTYFAGIDVTSADGVGDAFVERSVLPRGERPPVGAIVTMNLHAGYLGIPWVDDLGWSVPRPPESSLRVRLTKEELDEAVGRSPVGNALQEALRDLQHKPTCPAEGTGP